MPSSAEPESGAARQRLVSVREQQLSRRLGIRLWSKLGDEPVFLAPTSSLTRADATQYKSAPLKAESDRQTLRTAQLLEAESNLEAKSQSAFQSAFQSALQSEPQSNEELSPQSIQAADQPSVELAEAGSKTDLKLNGTDGSLDTKLNPKPQAPDSDSQQTDPSLKELSKSTKTGDVKDQQTGLDQSVLNPTAQNSGDSTGSADLPPRSEAVAETDVKSTSHQLPAVEYPDPTLDPNDAFADAAFMDAESFEEYSTGTPQAIHELLGKLGSTTKAPAADPEAPSQLDSSNLETDYHQESTELTLSNRVEWLSFNYRGYLVVAEAASISFDEQQLLDSIAQACDANLLPISFPLNQDDQLPAYFSDQLAFEAFIKGRMAQSETHGLIYIGQPNSPWELDFKIHQTCSLQDCLDNPLLKADLWRGLNPA